MLGITLFLLHVSNEKVKNLKAEQEALIRLVAYPIIEAGYDNKTGDVYVRINRIDSTAHKFAGMCPRKGYGL